jgi:hypothetical protein
LGELAAAAIATVAMSAKATRKRTTAARMARGSRREGRLIAIQFLVLDSVVGC